MIGAAYRLRELGAAHGASAAVQRSSPVAASTAFTLPSSAANTTTPSAAAGALRTAAPTRRCHSRSPVTASKAATPPSVPAARSDTGTNTRPPATTGAPWTWPPVLATHCVRSGNPVSTGDQPRWRGDPESDAQSRSSPTAGGSPTTTLTASVSV